MFHSLTWSAQTDNLTPVVFGAHVFRGMFYACKGCNVIVWVFIFCIYRYEAHEKGLIAADGVEFVPDVYTKNQNLQQDVQHLQKEAEKFRLAALYDFNQPFDSFALFVQSDSSKILKKISQTAITT